MLEQFKVKVRSSEDCRLVQNWAFDNGYKWRGYEKTVRYFTAGIFFNDTGYLTYIDEECYFDEHPYPEKTLKDLGLLKEKPKLREVKVGDIRKCYCTDHNKITQHYTYTVLGIFKENGKTFCSVLILDASYNREEQSRLTFTYESVQKDRRLG